jgi:TetR/AcrR family transcriptional regulator, mexJK operon transcriptional repressor
MCEAAGRQGDAVEAMRCGGSCLASLLHGLALDYIRLGMTPDAQDLYRAAVAESARVPQVGRAFFENGPSAVRRRLAPALREAAAQGELAVDDPDLAADQFFALCRAGIFERTLFGAGPAPTEDEIAAHAQRAVETFLRAYRPAEPQ